MYLSVVAITLLSVITANAAPSSAGCKAFPGDQAWPSTAEWDAFNQTVGGRLVATVPLGTPCHGSTFDNTTCEDLKSKWQFEEIQYVLSSPKKRGRSDSLLVTNLLRL
jgi:hypothetical protein